MKIQVGNCYLGRNPNFPDLYFTFYIIHQALDKHGRCFYIGVKVKGGALLITDYSLFWFNDAGFSDWVDGDQPIEDAYLDYRLIAKSRAKVPVIGTEDVSPYDRA